MLRRWNIWRSVLAGVLIGFAEGSRLPAPRHPRRPLGIVWIHDRRTRDPLEDLPVMILDPVALETGRGHDVRRRVSGALRLTLASPLRWLRRWTGDVATPPSEPGGVPGAGRSGSPGVDPQRWQRGQ